MSPGPAGPCHMGRLRRNPIKQRGHCPGARLRALPGPGWAQTAAQEKSARERARGAAEERHAQEERQARDREREREKRTSEQDERRAYAAHVRELLRRCYAFVRQDMQM
jgi:hypothetical protein